MADIPVSEFLLRDVLMALWNASKEYEFNRRLSKQALSDMDKAINTVQATLYKHIELKV